MALKAARFPRVKINAEINIKEIGTDKVPPVKPATFATDKPNATV